MTRKPAGSPLAVPSGSAFRRTLQCLDVDTFDELAGAWAQRPPDLGLLAALDHVHGAVLGQVEINTKTNETPRFSAP